MSLQTMIPKLIKFKHKWTALELTYKNTNQRHKLQHVQEHTKKKNMSRNIKIKSKHVKVVRDSSN